MGDSAIEKTKAAPLAKTQDASIEAVLGAALDKGRSAEELKQLHELYRQMKADQAKADYDEAFLAFQGECEPLPRTGKADEKTDGGTRIRFTFCTLSDLDTAIPLLAKHGFTRTFGKLHIEGAKATMECTLTHIGGHHVTEEADMPIASNFLKNPQNQVMGATSYLKRLLFGNMLGVPVCDLDDKVAPEGPAKTITEDQANGLNDLLIQATDTKPQFEEWKARLLAKAGVETLLGIPVELYEDFVKKLQHKIDVARSEGT